jgi:predicted cupin superfamily sugar epimerase
MLKYIELLDLKKHVEGGYFKVVYVSGDKVKPINPRYQNSDSQDLSIQRSAGSSIYFYLEKNDFSAFHRLKSDEIWHYYDGGSPIDIYIITPSGQLIKQILGSPAITPEASFQVIISAGSWFAAEVRDKFSFALVGCTVSPGFEYVDFELADRESLIKEYPHFRELIKKFTRADIYTQKKLPDSLKTRFSF